MKKYLPYILITVAGLGMLLTPFLAEAAKPKLHFWNPFSNESIAALSNLVLSVCIHILGIAAGLFDKVLSITMEGGSLLQSPIVKEGWTFARDLSNIFFIFIVIFIGIATILQIQGYGFKQLLLKVIVIALLVNFSLFFGNTIINISNSLAKEFYKPMADKNISEAFTAGTQIQTLYKTKGTSYETQLADAKSTSIILIGVMGSGLTLISAFVLFAGAIIFILRDVALSVLLILGPLAFVGMILPKTSQYASQWWEQLIKQALLAPAFLFMLLLTVSTISKQYTDIIKQPGGFAAAIIDKGGTEIFVQYLTLIILMLSCLTVAQLLGGKAASAGMSAARWAKGKTIGYAGRISRTGGRFAGRGVARLAEGKKISGKMERFAASRPRLGGWTREKMQQIAGLGGRKEQIERQVQRGMTLPAEQRAEYLMNLAKGPLADKQAQKEMFKKMSYRERVELTAKSPAFTKKPSESEESPYDKLLKTLGPEEREKTEKSFKEVRFANIVKQLGDKDNPLEDSEREELYKSLTEKQVKTIIDKGGEAAKDFFDGMKNTLGSDLNKLSDKLAEKGNKGLAGWMQSTLAAPVLKFYGLERKSAKSTKNN